MFNKKLKLQIKSLEDFVESQEERLSSLEKDYTDFLEWKKMSDANERTAATQGHWYISANDAALIEKCIQEINKDENLAALLTSAEGTTLSLRSHPQPKVSGNIARFNGLGEE